MTTSVGHVARLLDGRRRRLAWFIALSVLQFIAVAPVPFLVQRVFDTALVERRMGLLVESALQILALQIVASALGLAAAYLVLGASTSIVRELRGALFDRLYSFSIAYHDSTPAGDIHDRAVHETERVDTMMRGGWSVAVPSVIVAVGIMGVLVFINVQLFLVTVLFVPVVFGINRFAQQKFRAASRGLHASIEHFSAETFASLRVMRQTRILGAEAIAREREDRVLDETAHASFRFGTMRRAHLDLNRVAIAVWMILILLVGGASVVRQQLTLGELFAFYAGLALVRQPLDQIIQSIPVIVAGREALGRVYELLDADHPRPYCGTVRGELQGHLVIEDVTFGYGDGPPVLREVSLEIEPGQIVALVGPNGSGKTTLSNLILGFYRPTQGRITADGIDYGDLDIGHIRRQIGVLSQDPVMIAGTIYENIVYGRPDATASDVRRAVDAAAAGPLVDALEHGLATRAYENGPLLSGGQLQRIALARALLGSPKLLILDEPSSHLDDDGVASFIAGLQTLPTPPAVMLITHDRAVVDIADTVCRLEAGHLSLLSP